MRRGCLCLAGLILVIFLLLTGADRACAAVYSVSVKADDLRFEKVKGYDRVTMTDARSLGNPGNPLLPAKFVQITVPTELEAVGVEVISYVYEELPGTFEVWPSQPLVPLSIIDAEEAKVKFVTPNPGVYDLSFEYPGELAKVTNNGFLGGHHIAGVALYPLQYIPAEGKLILYTEIEFELILRPTTRLPASVNRRSEKTAEFYADIVKDVVINPEVVQAQAKGTFGKGDGEIDFLIITEDSLVSEFEELADWKIRKGISTKIETVSAVTSNYSGEDDQRKIRNCISHYYENHGTKWVLLGGDEEIIPARHVFLFIVELPPDDSNNNPATDLYYSDLEGTWDDNANGVYGEYPDNIDLYPDVFVGRAPSVTTPEAQTFVNKCLTYEAPDSLDYQRKILYAAEILWPGTDGAELKEYIDSAYVPDDWDTTKLYETRENLDKSTFGAALSDGQHIVNHAGHGKPDSIKIADVYWTSSDNDALTNSPRLSLFYSESCNSACFDLHDECFAEHFIHNDSGGGFAYCGNTRLGLGKRGFPAYGPSPEYDKEFFKAMFVDSIFQLGKTFAYSKIPLIPLSSVPDTADTFTAKHTPGKAYRYSMYTLVLLGDPTLELWSDEPDTLVVSHKSTLYVGEAYLKVDVNEDEALVTCVQEGELLGSAYSSEGLAVIYFDSPPDTDTMHVTVTKRNRVPRRDVVDVKDTTLMGTHLVYYSHTAIDSGTNANGGINPGDTVYMKVTLKNLGSLNPLSVKGSLATADTFISMIDDSGSWGGFGGKGGTMSQDDYFVFACASSCPDNHLVEFEIEWKVGASTWKDSLFQLVLEPDLIIETAPDTAVVRRTDSTDVVVTATAVAGFNTTVYYVPWAFPSGVNLSWHPDSIVTSSEVCTLRLHAGSEATEGVKVCSLYTAGQGFFKLNEIVVRVLPSPYQGHLLHVSMKGNDGIGDGSEDYPFRTIQKGMDEASSGDTVLVHRGAYLETIDFKGKAILVSSEVMYDSSLWTMDSTIINADRSGSVVIFDSDETDSSILRGFTLKNGRADKGAGVYCYNASPTIVMNKLVANACTTAGSGIYYYNSDTSMAPIKIERNLIHHCSGTGAIYLDGGNDAELINNTLANNDSNGLYIDGGCNTTVKNSIFWGNQGCEIVLDSGSCTISYSDVDTTSGEGYCGMDDQTGSNGNIHAWPDFRDTTSLIATGDTIANYRFVDSTSLCIDAGDPADTAPWWGCDRIDMGAIEFPLEYVPGDVQADGVVNWGDYDYLGTHYEHDDGCYPPPSCDVNCDGYCDYLDGIYLRYYLETGENPPVDSCHYKCGDKSEEGQGREEVVARTESANLPRSFSLSQNHPNPFNPETKISFALPRDCHVTLTIYNVIGQKVKTLVDEPKAAGWHEAIWYGKDEKGQELASGVYFYRLEADEFSQSKKMLLLK